MHNSLSLSCQNPPLSIAQEREREFHNTCVNSSSKGWANVDLLLYGCRDPRRMDGWMGFYHMTTWSLVGLSCGVVFTDKCLGLVSFLAYV
mmetsp:Transcript_22642/g.52266  ORF Transcript_22642/g.52266 Transcript_22642/m.52266 type:complete len:90 (+) Transcript_22642:695-964(+)